MEIHPDGSIRTAARFTTGCHPAAESILAEGSVGFEVAMLDTPLSSLHKDDKLEAYLPGVIACGAQRPFLGGLLGPQPPLSLRDEG